MYESSEREVWNRRYVTRNPGEDFGQGAWSQEWQDAVDLVRRGRALDLGCGRGFDTAELVERGFAVTAIDWSSAAVEIARRRNPSGETLVADVRNLPRKVKGPFQVVLANLSLHYFDRPETEAVFATIVDLLAPGGMFLARLNAEDDFGAPADATAWKLVEVEGVRRQFFNESKIRGLLDGALTILCLQKVTTGRFGRPKSLYEVVAQKEA
jgi:SAM-dependent methyltransferase